MRADGHDAGEAGSILTRVVEAMPVSLDYDETLAGIAQIAVRTVADFCVIDMIDGAKLRRVQTAHADPAYALVVRELLQYHVTPTPAHPSWEAIQSRRAVVVNPVTPALLASLSHDDNHRQLLEQLAPKSLLAIPLMNGDEPAGVIVFGSSTRVLGDEDIRLAGQIARFASLEVGHAGRLRDSQAAIIARDRVLRVVAHDLRNPLNVISLTAGFLAEMVPPDSDQRGHIDRILRAATGMDRLISDLLDVARIEGKRLALQCCLADPATVLREAVENGRTLATRKRQLLAADLPPSVRPSAFDRDRILQVLTNLIDNAIKFTPEEGLIRISVRDVDDSLHFSVRDSGPGVPPEHLELLFEPFWRGGNRSIEGAGLGLAIARGIVEAHGGRIWAESTPGTGSAFHFTLPVVVPRGET